MKSPCRKIHEIKYTRKIQVLQYVGLVGSWVMIVVILWVGLGWICLSCGLGWVVSYENGPMDNSAVAGRNAVKLRYRMGNKSTLISDAGML